jgi:hypothetical protein
MYLDELTDAGPSEIANAARISKSDVAVSAGTREQWLGHAPGPGPLLHAGRPNGESPAKTVRPWR